MPKRLNIIFLRQSVRQMAVSGSAGTKAWRT
jgi:hypothetical protein